MIFQKFKTFVINLEKRKDRLEQLQVPFEYEIFVGTDGHKKYEHENFHSRKRGALGCWDSHKRLLKKIIDLNLDYCLILEDDVVFCEDFEKKFNKVLSELPTDWDMLYLGGWNQNPPIKFSENLNLAEKVYTTHSYMITKKFVPKILHELENNTSTFKVDVLYGQIQQGNKCFITNPILCWQRPGFSDIENKITNNIHLK